MNYFKIKLFILIDVHTEQFLFKLYLDAINMIFNQIS